MSLRLIVNPIETLGRFSQIRKRDTLSKIFSKLVTLSPSFFSSIFTGLDIMFIYIFYRSSGKWAEMKNKTNVDFPRLQIATAEDPQKALHISFVILFSLVFFIQYPVRVFMLRHQRNTSLRQRNSKVWGFLYSLAGIFHLVFTLQTIFGIVSSSFVSGDLNEDFILDKESLTIVFYSFFHTGFTCYVFVWLCEDILIFCGHPEQINTLAMVVFRFLMLNIFIVSEVFWVLMVCIGNFRTSKFLGCNTDTFYGINQLVFLCGLVIFLVSVTVNDIFLTIVECSRSFCCSFNNLLNHPNLLKNKKTIQLFDEIELESNRNNYKRRRKKRRKRRKRIVDLTIVTDPLTTDIEVISSQQMINEKTIIMNNNNINIETSNLVLGVSTLEEEFSEEGMMPPGVYSEDDDDDEEEEEDILRRDENRSCSSTEEEEIYEVRSDEESSKSKNNRIGLFESNNNQEYTSIINHQKASIDVKNDQLIFLYDDDYQQEIGGNNNNNQQQKKEEKEEKEKDVGVVIEEEI